MKPLHSILSQHQLVNEVVIKNYYLPGDAPKEQRFNLAELPFYCLCLHCYSELYDPRTLTLYVTV